MPGSLKCNVCGYENEAAIISFDIENSQGNHERLYLLQCDQCRAFSVAIWEDAWTGGKEYWYFLGPYTAQRAEVIFLIFMSCRHYKDCDCEIHQAVYDWVEPFGKRIPIFERTELIEKIRANPDHSDWQKEWSRVVLT
jgi:hypothetical protein